MINEGIHIRHKYRMKLASLRVAFAFAKLWIRVNARTSMLRT